MGDFVAETLPQLFEIRESLPDPSGFHCFRGQSDVSWSLVPGMYRGLDWIDPARASGWDHRRLGEIERDLYREFARRSASVASPHPTDDKLELLFLAQHYGAPTRLLDWTGVLTTAAYFAVCEESEADAVVWCLNVDAIPFPDSLGRRPPKSGYSVGKIAQCVDFERLSFLLEHTGLMTDGADVTTRISGAIPSGQTGTDHRDGLFVIMDPPIIDGRIKNQQGLFSVYLSYDDQDLVLDHLGIIRDIEAHHGCRLISRITIPAGKKGSLRAALEDDAGVDPHALFPDLQGLALHQVRQRRRHLNGLRRERHESTT